MRQDALGRIRDSGTEQTWRQDATGTWRSNDGQTMRKDSLNRTRCSGGDSKPPSLYQPKKEKK
ncbi:MAG: hypothetical protein KAY06_01110 [Aeromonadaceae bacterium]|nr:hypothetical protein [Aeromonadaceae bacterium]